MTLQTNIVNFPTTRLTGCRREVDRRLITLSSAIYITSTMVYANESKL
jgi:hypothetical protein